MAETTEDFKPYMRKVINEAERRLRKARDTPELMRATLDVGGYVARKQQEWINQKLGVNPTSLGHDISRVNEYISGTVIPDVFSSLLRKR